MEKQPESSTKSPGIKGTHLDDQTSAEHLSSALSSTRSRTTAFALTHSYTMIFSRVVAVATLGLPLLAAATPLELEARQGAPQSCTTGSIQCCQQTQSVSVQNHNRSRALTFQLQANSAFVGIILGLLGIVLGDVTGLVGLDCSPISVIGVNSGNACSANTVCCENNNVVSITSGIHPVTSH